MEFILNKILAVMVDQVHEIFNELLFGTSINLPLVVFQKSNPFPVIPPVKEVLYTIPPLNVPSFPFPLKSFKRAPVSVSMSQYPTNPLSKSFKLIAFFFVQLPVPDDRVLIDEPLVTKQASGENIPQLPEVVGTEPGTMTKEGREGSGV